jgi:hypothetical protein
MSVTPVSLTLWVSAIYILKMILAAQDCYAIDSYLRTT